MRISKVFILASILALLAVLGGIGIFFQDDITARYVEVRERIAARDIYFMSGLKFKEFELTRLGFSKEAAVTIPVEGRVIDYDRAAGREVALVQALSGDEDVFIKIKDTSWALLTTDGGVKSRITFSPDGTLVAYAQRSDDQDSHFFEPSAWTIYTVNSKTGEIVEREPGFAPQFFVRDGSMFLSFLATGGFVTLNLDTGKRQVALLNTFYDGRRIPRVSPDGTLLGIYTPRDGGTYDIHPIERLSPLIIKPPVASLPTGTYLIEFFEDTLYAVRNTEDGVSTTLSVFPKRDVSKEIILRTTFDVPPAYQLIP